MQIFAILYVLGNNEEQKKLMQAVCVCTYIYVCVYKHICIYMCIYVCKYIYFQWL